MTPEKKPFFIVMVECYLVGLFALGCIVLLFIVVGLLALMASA